VLSGEDYAYQSTLAILDQGSLAVIASQQVRGGQRIAYDRSTQSLFIPSTTGYLVRLAYAPFGHAFTEAQLRTVSGYSTPFALSPDGSHLTVGQLDLLPSDFNQRYGAWGISYGGAADYRGDSAKTLLVGYGGIRIYDVSTHALDKTWSDAYDPCGYGMRARYSPSGSLAYVQYCGDPYTGYGLLRFIDLGAPVPPSPPVAEPPPGLSFDCAVEDMGPQPSGFLRTLPIGLADSILPACNGRVLVGNQANNRVETFDVRTGAIVGRSQLSAAPLELRRIPGGSFVLVRMDSTHLARVDMSTGAVVDVAMPTEVSAISPGETGQFFVSRYIPNGATWMDIYDGSTLSLQASQSMARTDLLAYDPSTRRLFCTLSEPGPEVEIEPGMENREQDSRFL